MWKWLARSGYTKQSQNNRNKNQWIVKYIILVNDFCSDCVQTLRGHRSCYHGNNVVMWWSYLDNKNFRWQILIHKSYRYIVWYNIKISKRFSHFFLHLCLIHSFNQIIVLKYFCYEKTPFLLFILHQTVWFSRHKYH